MKNKIKHICTIKDELNGEFKHLVEIDDKNVVFKFNKDKKLKSLDYSGIYSFAGRHKPSEMKNLIKLKGANNLNIGLYEYFSSNKFDNDYYFNLYKMQLKYDTLWSKFHNVLNVINKEVKINETVMLFNK